MMIWFAAEIWQKLIFRNYLPNHASSQNWNENERVNCWTFLMAIDRINVIKTSQFSELCNSITMLDCFKNYSINACCWLMKHGPIWKGIHLIEMYEHCFTEKCLHLYSATWQQVTMKTNLKWQIFFDKKTRTHLIK